MPPWKNFLTYLIVVVAAVISTTASGNDEIERYADNLRKIANPFETQKDLDLLFNHIGNRRTVLLGEATHGTREFYTWRAEITKRLVEEKNFSFIAVEGDWHAFVPVNRYVKNLPGAPGSAIEALEGLKRWPRWMWANEEMQKLLQWLREHNDAREDGQKVGIYGMDIYGAKESIRKGPQHMVRMDEEAAANMKAAFDCFAPYVDNPRDYIYSTRIKNDSCEAGIAGIIGHLQENRDAYISQNPTAYFHAAQNAAVVYRTEKHYRKMVNQDSSSWNARAENFYETIERLRNYYGEKAGAVAWAHNTHVGDARAMKTGPGMENLGMHARKNLGEDNVFIVGFGTHRGEVSASRTWEGEREIMRIPEALTGSLEDIMNRLDHSAMLFISRDADNIDIRRQIIGHRAIGVTYNPENERGNYVPTIWRDRYDAFIFIDKTGHLEPLPEG